MAKENELDFRTVKTINESLNKVIAEAALEEEQDIFNGLLIRFTDRTGICLYDYPTCCENRYMTTDDDLNELKGAKFLGVELKEVEMTDDQDQEHEIAFLDIKTDKGVFQIVSHNEHNGYYGGMSLFARPIELIRHLRYLTT